MGYDLTHHPAEEILELFVLGAEEVRDQRGEIAKHLDACEGCRAMHAEMAEYYSEVETLRDQQAANAPDALAVRDRIVPFSGGPLYPGGMVPRQPLAVRMVATLVRHPVRTSMGFLAVLAVLLGVNYKSKIWKDTNPSVARGLRDSLVVFNKDGEELWARWIGFRNDLNFLPDWFQLQNWMVTMDLTGDGLNEVISCIPLRHDSSGRNYMGSWNPDGSLRWEYEFHRDMSLGGEKLPDRYRFLGMVVDRFVPGGRVEILAVAEEEHSDLRAVVRLDAATGVEKAVYWHAGNIFQFKSLDRDADGVKEFYYSGRNEPTGSSFLAVLDPRYLDGHAPSGRAVFPDSIGRGTDKYYILFPRPDVETGLSGDPMVTGQMIVTAPDSLKIVILTKVNDRLYLPLEYHFNPEMVCTRVTTNPDFISYHREMERKGLLKRKYDSSYLEEMRKQLRYWDGEKFVYEPVMNGRYPGGGKGGSTSSTPPSASR